MEPKIRAFLAAGMRGEAINGLSSATGSGLGEINPTLRLTTRWSASFFQRIIRNSNCFMIRPRTVLRSPALRCSSSPNKQSCFCKNDGVDVTTADDVERLLSCGLIGNGPAVGALSLLTLLPRSSVVSQFD